MIRPDLNSESLTDDPRAKTHAIRALTVKSFDGLTTRELYAILSARAEVFVAEQGIIYCDPDGVDLESLHCFFEQEGRIVAYLRAFSESENAVRVGRVLTVKDVRGTGLGKELFEKSIPEISKHFSCDLVKVDAQMHAAGFYERLGFTVTSDSFMEEGIPHIKMELRVR